MRSARPQVVGRKRSSQSGACRGRSKKGWKERLSGTDKPPPVAPVLARLTKAELEAGMTNGLGVTRKQAAAWGLPWPLRKGWKRSLLKR